MLRLPGRRSAIAALCAIAATVGMSACTTQEHQSPDAVTTTPAITEQPSSAPSVVPSSLVKSVTDAPIVPASRAGGLMSSPWTLIARSADGRTLTVRANQGGGCDQPRGIEITQTRTDVALASVYLHRSPPPERGCLASLAAPLWRIFLDAPLGNRVLVHLPASGSVP